MQDMGLEVDGESTGLGQDVMQGLGGNSLNFNLFYHTEI